MNPDLVIINLESNMADKGEKKDYKSVCREAVHEPGMFRVFRREPAYASVAENVTKEQGQLYLNELLRWMPQWFQDDCLLYRICENDTHGSPTVYEYTCTVPGRVMLELYKSEAVCDTSDTSDGSDTSDTSDMSDTSNGNDTSNRNDIDSKQEYKNAQTTPTMKTITISPTTLRYMKIIADFIHEFGWSVLSTMNMIELGAGYGGFARLATLLLKPASYCTIDLPFVSELIQIYLAKTDPDAAARILHMTTDDLKVRPSLIRDYIECMIPTNDRPNVMIISNYALSQYPRSERMFYHEAMVEHCNYAYITSDMKKGKECGEWIQGFTHYMKIDIMDEIPKTGADHFILIGKPIV